MSSKKKLESRLKLAVNFEKDEKPINVMTCVGEGCVETKLTIDEAKELRKKLNRAIDMASDVNGVPINY